MNGFLYCPFVDLLTSQSTLHWCQGAICFSQSDAESQISPDADVKANMEVGDLTRRQMAPSIETRLVSTKKKRKKEKTIDVKSPALPVYSVLLMVSLTWYVQHVSITQIIDECLCPV